MNILRLFYFTILAILVVACSKQETKSENGENHPSKNGKILTGKLTAAHLYEQMPEYKSVGEEYQPDEGIVIKLASFSFPVSIDVFLGTWCPDSRRQVPRFLKIMDLADNANFQYQLYGLDRSKRDSEGSAEKSQIEYVPTFIISHNQKEIGRIVENPMVSIEHDLLEIVLAIGN